MGGMASEVCGLVISLGRCISQRTWGNGCPVRPSKICTIWLHGSGLRNNGRTPLSARALRKPLRKLLQIVIAYLSSELRSLAKPRSPHRPSPSGDLPPFFRTVRGWKILIYPLLAGRRIFHEEVAVQRAAD